MSKEFSTVLEMGASAPFILVMQLPVNERREFIARVSPNMAETFKRTVLAA